MPTPDPTLPSKRFETLFSWQPLLWLSLAFLAGILLASWLNLPFVVWLILAGLAAVLAGLLRYLLTRTIGLPPQTWFLIALSLVAIGLGAARYQAAIPRANVHHVSWFNDRPGDMLVTGVIAGPPDYLDTYTNLRIEVAAVDTGSGYGDVRTSDLILAQVDAGETYLYGELVRLRGSLETPPEDEVFSYRDYLARRGIYAYMPAATVTRLPYPSWGDPFLRTLFAFKQASLEQIYLLFPDPEASLLAGILLGVDTGLAVDLQEAFKNTGTAHIIAISAFNITIIAGLFATVFSRLLGPRRGALAAVVGIAACTLLVGVEPAVVRAVLMGGLGLFARQIGHRQSALNTLAFTGAIMALLTPHIPWDVGFQLSFFATLGLILYASPFEQWAARLFERGLSSEIARRVATFLAAYVLFTLAAQLTTLPIMAYHFQRIPLVTLIASPFILPAQPAVMLLGGLAVLLSFIYFPIGQLAAWAAWPFPAYTIRVVEFFDRLPHGMIVLGDFSLLFVLLFYGLLFGWTFSQGTVKAFLRQVFTPSIVLASLGIVAFLLWRGAFAAPDGYLHITFLDVGTGEAVLIQTPSGRNVLVNGGPSVTLLSDSLGRRISPFNRQIDFLVIASTREQHVASLVRTLDRFPPAQVLWSGQVEASSSARQLDRWLADHGTPVHFAAAGDALDLGAGARLRVLSVTPRGAVLLLEWGEFRLLLPSGANFDSLAALDDGAAVGPVSVLLLADSGYAPVNPITWIDNLQPQVIVLSGAAGNPDGLPDPETLVALEGRSLLRTDRHGWIEISTNGLEFWVDVERP
ncbi:MAG: ComEC/Rec2 family competence protein [Anaerolineales bacterium]|nr:ComEC/Rec2 family competence protein [Anaerolineales bacterium]